MTTPGERAIDASKRLDKLLREPIEATMPEVGGNKFAGEISGMLGDLKKQVAEAVKETRLDIAAAAAELVTEVGAGKQIARAIRAETAAVRAAYGEVLGNAPPEEGRSDKIEPEKPATKPDTPATPPEGGQNG